METPFPRGALVEKISARSEDTHRVGARGRIADAVGPTLPESAAPGQYGYWVEFEKPVARVFVAGSRLRAVSAD